MVGDQDIQCPQYRAGGLIAYLFQDDRGFGRSLASERYLLQGYCTDSFSALH
jgi:hypothetical protein